MDWQENECAVPEQIFFLLRCALSQKNISWVVFVLKRGIQTQKVYHVAQD